MSAFHRLVDRLPQDGELHPVEQIGAAPAPLGARLHPSAVAFLPEQRPTRGRDDGEPVQNTVKSRQPVVLRDLAEDRAGVEAGIRRAGKQETAVLLLPRLMPRRGRYDGGGIPRLLAPPGGMATAQLLPTRERRLHLRRPTASRGRHSQQALSRTRPGPACTQGRCGGRYSQSSRYARSARAGRTERNVSSTQSTGPVTRGRTSRMSRSRRSSPRRSRERTAVERRGRRLKTLVTG